MHRLFRSHWMFTAIAVTLLLAACNGPARVGAVEFGIEPTSTPVPTPTLTPTPTPAVETYTDETYGFAFDYLSTWSLSKEPHTIRLRQDTLQLTIGYRWSTDSVDITQGRTGVPAGDWIYGGKVSFLDQVVPAQVLEYQRKDKAVFYGGTELIETADLAFVIVLEDLDAANYKNLDLPKLAQAEAQAMLESFRRVEATGRAPAPSPTPPPAPTRTPTPAPSGGEVAVIGWYGSVHSAPAGSGYDDYLAVLPEGVAEVGLVGLSPAVEAAIAEMRDREPPSRYAHFWGTLACGVADYNGCRLAVTHMRSDGPGPLLNPDPVEGWEGTVITNSAWAQIDDAFVLAGDYPVHYGLWSADPTLEAELKAYRNTGTPIRLWGELLCGVPDANGCQLQVNRLEEAQAAGSAGPETAWAGYDNADYGFSFQYPASWEIEEIPGRALDTGNQPAGAMPARCADAVLLRQEERVINIQFMRAHASDDGPTAWCEMNLIHEPTDRDTVPLMGRDASRTALVHEGAVKAVNVSYLDEDADLVLQIAFYDGSETAYTAAEMATLPDSALVEFEQILGSLQRTQ